MISRYKLYFSLTFSVILCISGVNGSVIKQADEEHLKDIAHNDGIESIKHDKQKGEKIHQVDSQLNDNHKNQYSKVSDDAKYLNKEHDTKAASDSDAYKGYNTKQDKSEDSEATGHKSGHKKGHHNQGFQNTYHKDESSNKSTFFDDFNDEGDRAAYNSRLNFHDDQGGRNYHGGHKNAQEHVRDNYHGGGYNRYGDNGVKQHNHQDHGKKYYLDDTLRHNRYRNDQNSYDRDNIRSRQQFYAPEPSPQPHHQDPGWDWQRWEAKGDWNQPGWRESDWQRDRVWQNDPNWQNDPGWDKNYGGPGYYDDQGFRHEGGYGYGPQHGYGYGESRPEPVAEIPRNAPVVAHRKQTITIYEDPRYDGKDKGQLRREEGDYLQLEFKPSGHRYASYDDTYYNVPATREGAMETSKINRLVYNYRGQ